MFGWLGVLSASNKSTSHEYRCPGAKEGIVSGGNIYVHTERNVDLFLVHSLIPFFFLLHIRYTT